MTSGLCIDDLAEDQAVCASCLPDVFALYLEVLKTFKILLNSEGR
jgi:hypothetical protein